MSKIDTRSHGTPASAADRSALRALVERLGEVGAAKHLKIDRLTVARALAELPLQARTHDHLRRMLADAPAQGAA